MKLMVLNILLASLGLGHEACVTFLAVSPDSAWIASGAALADRSIILWDAQHHSVTKEWYLPTGSVHCLSFSPDSTRLACAGGTAGILILDVLTGATASELPSPLPAVRTRFSSCVWSPDGTKVVAGLGENKTVLVYDAFTFDLLQTLDHSYLDAISLPVGVSIRVSPTGKYLACFNLYRGWKLWEYERGRFISHETFSSTPSEVVFDARGRMLATLSPESPDTAHIFDIATTEKPRTLNVGSAIIATAFSLNGQKIFFATMSSTVQIWDPIHGRFLNSFDVGQNHLPVASFSSGGKYVAWAQLDNTVKLYRTSDGCYMSVNREHMYPIVHIAFSRDGEKLVTGDSDGMVVIQSMSSLVQLEDSRYMHALYDYTLSHGSANQ